MQRRNTRVAQRRKFPGHCGGPTQHPKVILNFSTEESHKEEGHGRYSFLKAKRVHCSFKICTDAAFLLYSQRRSIAALLTGSKVLCLRNRAKQKKQTPDYSKHAVTRLFQQE